MRTDVDLSDAMRDVARTYACRPNDKGQIVDMINGIVFENVGVKDTILFLDPEPDANISHPCMYIRMRHGSSRMLTLYHGWGPNETACPTERVWPKSKP